MVDPARDRRLPGAARRSEHRRGLHSAAQHRPRAVDARRDRRRQARAVRKAARARSRRRGSHCRRGRGGRGRRRGRLHVPARAADRAVLSLINERRDRRGPRDRVGIHLRARTRAHNIRLDPALGGGALWDVGCYPVTLRAADRRARAEDGVRRGALAPIGRGRGVHGHAAVRRRPTANIYAGFRAAYRTWLEILGSRRRADRAESVQARTARDARARAQRRRRAHRRWPARRRSSCGRSRTSRPRPRRRPAVVTLAESRRTAATLAALYAAARRDALASAYVALALGRHASSVSPATGTSAR